MPRYKVGTGQVTAASSSLVLAVGQTQTFHAGLYDSNDNPIPPDPGTAHWTSTDGGAVLRISHSASSPGQCSVTAVAAGSSTLEHNADFSGQPYSAQFAINVSYA